MHEMLCCSSIGNDKSLTEVTDINLIVTNRNLLELLDSSSGRMLLCHMI